MKKFWVVLLASIFGIIVATTTVGCWLTQSPVTVSP